MAYHGSPLDSMRSEIEKAVDREDRRLKRKGRMPIRSRRWRTNSAAYEEAKAFNIAHGIGGAQSRTRTGSPGRLLGSTHSAPSKKPVTLPIITMPLCEE